MRRGETLAAISGWSPPTLARRDQQALADADAVGAAQVVGPCLAHFDQAEATAKELGDLVQTGMIYNRRGLAYWHHGLLEPAFECLQKAEEISVAVGNHAWIAAHRTNQGLVLADMDRFDESVSLFEAAARSHNKLGYQHWAAVNFGGWGRALMMRRKEGDLDRSTELIKEAEALARKVYYPENIALHVGDLGRVYMEQGRTFEAYRAVREAIALERRMSAHKDIRHFNNLVTLARTCAELERQDEQWEAITRAISLKKNLSLGSQHQIRKVREDVQHLEKVCSEWRESYGLCSHPDQSHVDILRPPEALAGMSLKAQQTIEILQSVMEVLEQTGYEYPWTGLESELVSAGSEVLPLLGYGSLVNRESAEKTIRPASERGFFPCVGFGVVRLLDYEMPEAVRERSSYARRGATLNRGLFNSRFTGSICDFANGILVDVALEDIQALREREVGYDLRPIVCIPWSQRDSRPFRAYALGCAGRNWKGEMLSNHLLLPHPEYLKLCIEGAASISDEFLEFWLETSFLADGTTSVKKWLKAEELDIDFSPADVAVVNQLPAI